MAIAHSSEAIACHDIGKAGIKLKWYDLWECSRLQRDLRFEADVMLSRLFRRICAKKDNPCDCEKPRSYRWIGGGLSELLKAVGLVDR